MTVVRGFVAIVVSGLVLAACAQLTEPEAEILAQSEQSCYDLFAGQDTDVGSVCVRATDDDAVEVTFSTDEPWKLSETHLAVSNEQPGDEWVEEGWQNRKKNPVPGQFPYSDTHDQAVASYSYTVDAVDAKLDLDKGLYIAAHAVVKRQGGYFADTVLSVDQGVLKDGTQVSSARSNPNRALTKDYPLSSESDDDIGFFSLGFDLDPDDGVQEGVVEVGYECPVSNGEGDDITIWEVTFAPYPSESADVEAWDGEQWVPLGRANNENAGPQGTDGAHTVSHFDLEDAGLASTNRLRIVDSTDPSLHNGSADAFDLDGIQALHDCTQDETAWGADGEAGEFRFVERGNWATYISYPAPTAND